MRSREFAILIAPTHRIKVTINDPNSPYHEKLGVMVGVVAKGRFEGNLVIEIGDNEILFLPEGKLIVFDDGK